ncbi:zinc-binding alcohol dehydrogenase family protein [candidate division KSB1 bacterium]|nr:zinc-binding alcohol dehydrogenase family protein [candidate division KSB1 bacterium]
MKAFRITNPGKTDFIDIPEPIAGPDDVLLEINYIGLCGSDLSTFRGTMPMMDYPRIPGHEIAGRIIGKGKNVPDTLQLGDAVMVSPYTHCGTCPACRIGRTNTCQLNQTFGVQRDGALTEKLAVHSGKIFKSTQLSLQELALVEPLSVGYHAANRGKVSETDKVLIFGCGAIGMGVLAACVRKGATAIVVDIDNSKLEHARKMGAHYTINSLEQSTEKIVAGLTDNEGVNIAIEAAGIPSTFKQAIELVTYAGRVVYIGYTKNEVALETKLIVRKELQVSGSRNALHVFPSVIKMLEKGDLPFTSLVTKVFSFEKTGDALRFWDENPGKVVKLLIDVKK